MRILNIRQWSILTVLMLSASLLTAQQTKNGNSTASLDMILFEGDFDDKFIELKWSPKAKPEDIQKYIIEYSKDAVNYRQIGTRSPDLKNIYTYKSIAYQAGTNYFRIIQVDKSGHELISDGVNVMCGFPDRYDLDVEHADDKLKIKLQVRTSQRVQVELLDQNGEIKESLYSGEMERNEMIFRTIDASNFARGTYYLSIRGQAFRLSEEIEL